MIMNEQGVSSFLITALSYVPVIRNLKHVQEIIKKNDVKVICVCIQHIMLTSISFIMKENMSLSTPCFLLSCTRLLSVLSYTSPISLRVSVRQSVFRLRKACQRIWMLPLLIKELSAACQALGDGARDREPHHKGIPSIMFRHDINICHTPLTMQYCTPGVRHLSISELQRKPIGIVCVRVPVYLHICLQERGGVYGCITSPSLFLL